MIEKKNILIIEDDKSARIALSKALEKTGFKDISLSSYSISLNIKFLTDFFLIPAQSASLFPKATYEERIHKITTLFASLKDYQDREGNISWTLVKARK